jgi:CheY-like chemotaxis protein
MPERLILVVDDDALVLDFVADVFRMHDYAVDTATNGREAMGLLEERRYDLIVSNMGMPLLDGPGLFDEVRQRFGGGAPPFLFLTGDYEKPDYARFFQEAGVPALAKPFAPATLLETAARILRAGGS